MNQHYSFVDIHHGDPFPMNAVQALDRPLQTSDSSCAISYVALWYYNGEVVFGRAHSNNGRVVAYFPWGDKEHCSDRAGTFKILVSQFPGEYRWVPLNTANRNSVVTVDSYSPCVITGVKSADGRLRNSEMLGKTQLSRQMAWSSWDGRVIVHTGSQFQNIFVLCRADSFALKCRLNGKVLDVEGAGGWGSRLIAHTPNRPKPSPNQLWRMESAGNGWYFLVSAMNPNLVMDVEGGRCVDCAKVIVWTKKMPPSPNQLWRILGSHIESALGNNKVLNIEGANTNDGAKMIIYQKQGNALNEMWEVNHV